MAVGPGRRAWLQRSDQQSPECQNCAVESRPPGVDGPPTTPHISGSVPMLHSFPWLWRDDIHGPTRGSRLEWSDARAQARARA